MFVILAFDMSDEIMNDDGTAADKTCKYISLNYDVHGFRFTVCSQEVRSLKRQKVPPNNKYE